MRRCTRLRIPRWGTLVADNENAFDIQFMRPCDNVTTYEIERNQTWEMYLQLYLYIGRRKRVDFDRNTYVPDLYAAE